MPMLHVHYLTIGQMGIDEFATPPPPSMNTYTALLNYYYYKIYSTKQQNI